MVNLNNIL